MTRRKFVAGNWKMFTNAASGRALAAAIVQGVNDDAVRVGVFPPYPYLGLVAEVVKGSKVALGAQNLYPAKEGAFTGEVSPQMLKDVGCEYVIVGHSERRQGLGERDAFINQKLHAALEAELSVILCVGETLDEREANQTFEVLKQQLTAGLQGFNVAQIDKLVLAYEPVWAIGTGRNATPEQAQEVHAFIRSFVTQMFVPGIGDQLVIQYGGSVKPENAEAILAQADVDGVLVGGASLVADGFLSIVRAAAAVK